MKVGSANELGLNPGTKKFTRLMGSEDDDGGRGLNSKICYFNRLPRRAASASSSLSTGCFSRCRRFPTFFFLCTGGGSSKSIGGARRRIRDDPQSSLSRRILLHGEATKLLDIKLIATLALFFELRVQHDTYKIGQTHSKHTN